jgi:hypothetical protein
MHLVPVIIDLKAYNGFERRVERLGLSPVLDELKELITGFDLRIAERRHANGTAAILRDRELSLKGRSLFAPCS